MRSTYRETENPIAVRHDPGDGHGHGTVLVEHGRHVSGFHDGRELERRHGRHGHAAGSGRPSRLLHALRHVVGVRRLRAMHVLAGVGSPGNVDALRGFSPRGALAFIAVVGHVLSIIPKVGTNQFLGLESTAFVLKFLPLAGPVTLQYQHGSALFNKSTLIPI